LLPLIITSIYYFKSLINLKQIFRLVFEFLKFISGFEINFCNSFNLLLASLVRATWTSVFNWILRARPSLLRININAEENVENIYVTNQIPLFSRFLCSESVISIRLSLHLPCSTTCALFPRHSRVNHYCRVHSLNANKGADKNVAIERAFMSRINATVRIIFKMLIGKMH